MQLDWIELTDFRSYGHVRFEPEAGVNVLVGDNGAGKTNLLEAVTYLSGLRSFRGVADGALVRSGGTAAVVRGEFGRRSGSLVVEVEVPAAGRRRVLVNGKRPARYREVAAAVPVVAFLPDDLDLVKRGPGLRRDYLDDVAAQRWRGAAAEQQEYDRALKQRNALLRDHGREVDAATLDAWDERAAATGARLLHRRLQLLADLAPLTAAAYEEIAPGGEAMTWAYRSAGAGTVAATDTEPELAARLRGALAERRRLDVERRVTTVGPHRDEPGLVVGGRDARSQASQGEQRSVALALRLAAFDLLEGSHQTSPILALDDVFSELDEKRAAGLVARLPSAQVFVTTARPEDVPVTGRRWAVGGGGVR